MQQNDYIEFDPANFIDSDEMAQAYLDEAAETGDPAFIASALGDIAKAKGMSRISKKTGLSRENLYKTLSKDGNPNLKTLAILAQALNVIIKIGFVQQRTIKEN